MSLIADRVTGGYSHLPVLKDISFNVQPEGIVGLIGLDRAGKSTTIKHIIGLLEATGGAIEINHLSLKRNTKEYRKQIRYISETPSLYEELTLRGHIEVIAMAYDIPMDTAMKRAREPLEAFRLPNHLDWFSVSFSKGMKQKVMILCAFLIEPSLYIIDEPFLELDPLAINALFELIIEIKKKGAGILIPTHILATAEKYCDCFMISRSGEIRTNGALGTLREEFHLPDSSLGGIYAVLIKEQAHE